MSRKIIEKIKRKAISVLNTISVHPSDVMLASFPKSGNTWVRFLLSNIIAMRKQEFLPIDFFSIQDIIPDIHRVVLTAKHRYAPFPRIIKTHHARRSNYGRVIYLIRNPEKVLLSYYIVIRSVDRISDMPLSDFIRNKRYGLPAWIHHVLSYIDYADLVVSYDHLQKDPISTLQSVAEYFSMYNGISIPAADICTAIKASNLENMRTIEKTKGRPFQRRGYNFVRPTKGRQTFMQPEDREYIRGELNKYKSLVELFSG